jgi:glycosyltransferase involved in cell wall biosynthesis
MIDVCERLLVSVCCITYNHEKYIHDTIRGFLYQKTSFQVEFLIHDDASTDNTQSIVRDLVGSDERFKLILRTENIKSTGAKVFPILIDMARGKYLAFCEGDDYWTDPLKLQKQVDILNSNNEIGLVFSDYSILFQESNFVVKSAQGAKISWLINKNYTIYEKLLMDSFIGTLTVMFRKSFLDGNDIKVLTESKWIMGDRLLWLLLSRKTQFYYLDEVTAMYRRNQGSISNVEKDDTSFFNQSYQIRFYFIQQYGCSKEVKFIVERDYYKGLIARHFQYFRKKDLDMAFYNLKKLDALNFKDYYFFIGTRSFFLHSIFTFALKVYNKIFQ